jgi:hypothetical protein
MVRSPDPLGRPDRFGLLRIKVTDLIDTAARLGEDRLNTPEEER